MCKVLWKMGWGEREREISLKKTNYFSPSAFIFYNHTHGREILDIFVHQILVLVIFLAGLLAFLEIFIRHNVLLELLRASFILLQGSWFWQVSWGPQSRYLVSSPITFCLCLVGHFAPECRDFLLISCCSENVGL